MSLQFVIDSNRFKRNGEKLSHILLLASKRLSLLFQIKREDLQYAIEACSHIHISSETYHRMNSQGSGLKKIEYLDINLNITLKPEQWTRILGEKEDIISDFPRTVCSQIYSR